MAFLLFSCDPGYQYEFYFNNETSREVSVHYKKMSLPVEPNEDFALTPVPSKTKVLLFQDKGMGWVGDLADTTCYENISCIRVWIDSMMVFCHYSLRYRQCPTDGRLWDHAGTLQGAGKSSYIFTLKESDILK
jgi:hypothetical protein